LYARRSAALRHFSLTNVIFFGTFSVVIDCRSACMKAMVNLEENILDLLGLTHLPESRKTELLTRMTEVVQDRISDRVFEMLSADERAAFDRLLERGASDEEVGAFLVAKIPEYHTIAAEEALRFKRQMVNDVATVRKIADVSQPHGR
jgi:hypothetical protein